jgi:hypothetical protein
LAVMARSPKDTPLRYVILDDQLWTIGSARIAAIQTEIVGCSVVIVIQFEAQADLGQPGVRGNFVDIVLSTRQVNAVPTAGKGRLEGTIRFACGGLEISSLQCGCAKVASLDIHHESLEGRDRIASADDALFPDLERHFGDDRGVWQAAAGAE